MQDKMDIKDFFIVLRKRIITIIIVSLSIFLLVGIVSLFFMKPTYEAKENVVVGKLNKQGSEYGESRELSMLLASTIDFIKSPSVLSTVSQEFEIPYETLEEQVVVQNSRDSQIVSVIVRGSDPQETREIANFIAVTTVNKMNELFEVKDIVVLSDSIGETSAERIGNTTVNLGIGLIVGILAGIGMALFKEHLDDSIKSSKQVEKELGILVLGDINLKKKTFWKGKSKETHVHRDKQLDVEDKEKRGEISV